MGQGKATELWLIRHAPALHGGALAGRRDVAADCSDRGALAGMRAATAGVSRHVTSPALRCRQTAQALWPGVEPAHDPRLWEQDFGAWEGMPFADLPDLGPLSAADLTDHCPPRRRKFCAALRPRHPGTAHTGTRRRGGRCGPCRHDPGRVGAGNGQHPRRDQLSNRAAVADPDRGAARRWLVRR